MHLFLVFCERAATGSTGKLDLGGVYNELYAPGFPARQDRLVLAGIIEWDRHIAGQQQFLIQLLDPADKPIFAIEGHSDVDARSAERAPAKTHLVFPLENLVFENAGQYRVRVEVCGRQMNGSSLHVVRSRAVTEAKDEDSENL